MKFLFHKIFKGVISMVIPFFFSVSSFSQTDSSIITLSKETVLSEVAIRNDLDVVSFLNRVKDDTSFYKAFKNLLFN